MNKEDFDLKYSHFLLDIEDVDKEEAAARVVIASSRSLGVSANPLEGEFSDNKDIKEIISKSLEYVKDYKEAHKPEAIEMIASDRNVSMIPFIKEPIFKDNILVGWQKAVDRRTNLDREADLMSSLLR